MAIDISAVVLIVCLCCLTFTAEVGKRTVDGLEPEYKAIHSEGLMYKAAVVFGYPARVVWDRRF